MDLDPFDALVQRVEDLLLRIRSLKEENQTLKTALQEKEALVNRLTQEKETVEAAKDEGRQRLEDLLQRIEEEVGQV
ncbi:MAG: cell division protein ZapB [Deltaproteobacteria bacterium]|nr:cell division protein ZapB [Deltaproteobacteria bacterium]